MIYQFEQSNLFIVFQNFKMPLFVVLCHFILKFFLAAMVRIYFALARRKTLVQLTWRHVLTVGLTGCAGALDIGASNWSFKYITISLWIFECVFKYIIVCAFSGSKWCFDVFRYTMSKSTCIVFILLFGVLLSIEKLVGMLFITYYYHKMFIMLLCLCIL